MSEPSRDSGRLQSLRGWYAVNESPRLPDVWSAEIAGELPGKMVLVGISYLSADGVPRELRQFYGRVELADPSVGIVLVLDGKRSGEKYTLPPDTRPIVVAPPGEYSLRSTGEVVVDPDYTVTYTSRGGPGAAVE